MLFVTLLALALAKALPLLAAPASPYPGIPIIRAPDAPTRIRPGEPLPAAEIHQTPPVNRGGGTLGEADAMALYQAAMLAAVQASPRVDDLMAAILGDDDADLAAFCIIGSLAIQSIWDVPLAHRPTLMGILIAEMQAGL